MGTDNEPLAGKTVICRTVPDAAELARLVAGSLAARIRFAQQHGDEAHVVVTGGSIGTAVIEHFVTNVGTRSTAELKYDGIAWDRLHIWWSDERFLPAADENRNDQQAFSAGLLNLPIPADNLHRMPAAPTRSIGTDAAAGPPVATPDEKMPDRDPSSQATSGQETSCQATQTALPDAAARYVAELEQATAQRKSPRFDVVLLSMGPDGHIASLFPGHPELQERDRLVVAVPDSPKPPPQRLSLTLPALADSHEVWILVSGEEKSDMVRQVLIDHGDLPVTRLLELSPTTWFLDYAAAIRLHNGNPT